MEPSPELEAVQTEYLRLAATLWAGTAPLDAKPHEGPRHLRLAGVRLMPTVYLQSSAAGSLKPISTAPPPRHGRG